MDIQEIIATVTIEEIEETEEIVRGSYENGFVGSQMIMIAFD